MSFVRKIQFKSGQREPKSDQEYTFGELSKRPRRKRHISVGALPFANRKLPLGMRPLG